MRNDWNDYLMHRQHKYIKKVKTSRGWRYFYTPSELQAYYGQTKKQMEVQADANYDVQKSENKRNDAAEDKILNDELDKGNINIAGWAYAKGHLNDRRKKRDKRLTRKRKRQKRMAGVNAAIATGRKAIYK